MAQLIININYGNSSSLQRHLALRVYEDVGYMDFARGYITDKELPKLNLNYFNSGEVKGVVSKMVEEKINEHVKEVAPQVYEKYQIEDCYMPWCRMFEVALKVKER